jgi:hypothetical protein
VLPVEIVWFNSTQKVLVGFGNVEFSGWEVGVQKYGPGMAVSVDVTPPMVY